MKMDTVAAVIIVLSAIAYSFILNTLLNKFGGRQRINEIQREVNETNKAYFEAGKKNDAKKIAELEVKMKQLPKLMSESMVLNLKCILITLPTIGIVLWLVRFAFPAFTIALPFDLPVPRFQPNQLFEMKNVFGTYGWFIISAVVFGGIAQFIYSKIKKK